MNKTLLLIIGVAALGGGAYYLYRSGKMVSEPGYASAAPAQYLGPMQRVQANIQIPRVY